MSVFSIGDHNWEFYTYDKIWYKSNDATCKACGYKIIYSPSNCLDWIPRNASDAEWGQLGEEVKITHPSCSEYIMKKVLE